MAEQRKMDGKVVIVMGLGGGIGRDIAPLMAREGAKIVINDVGAALTGEGQSVGPAQEVVDEIMSVGGEATANTGSVARIVQQAVDTFGRIDCVVNNVGILRDRFFHKMSQEEWDALLKVHLYGSYYVSRTAADQFKEQGDGAFVQMMSTSGLIGNLAHANYSAARLGIAGLSKSIALDLKKFGVRSNCVAPFARSRINSIKVDMPEQVARVEKIKQMTPAKIAEHAIPALRSSFHSLDVSADVFSRDLV